MTELAWFLLFLGVAAALSSSLRGQAIGSTIAMILGLVVVGFVLYAAFGLLNAIVIAFVVLVALNL